MAPAPPLLRLENEDGLGPAEKSFGKSNVFPSASACGVEGDALNDQPHRRNGFGPFHLDADQHLLTRQAQPVALPPSASTYLPSGQITGTRPSVHQPSRN
jgi:hypothetical protein